MVPSKDTKRAVEMTMVVMGKVSWKRWASKWALNDRQVERMPEGLGVVWHGQTPGGENEWVADLCGESGSKAG